MIDGPTGQKVAALAKPERARLVPQVVEDEEEITELFTFGTVQEISGQVNIDEWLQNSDDSVNMMEDLDGG